MGYANLTVRELVDRAVSHSWSIPEFQRGFVWKSTQVRDLAESLWLDYPIGSLLVWNGQNGAEPKGAIDAQSPSQWVVDGQQRVTALCILSGRKPYWWTSADLWSHTLARYDIRFDVNAKEPPYFWVANAAIRKVKGDRYLSLSRLLVLDIDKPKDQQALQELAKQIKLQGLCDGQDVMDVYARLDRIRKIRDKTVVTISIDQELEDVVEIFSRLNSKGTRVTEADIYLGVVAARIPGWVRSEFLPYVRKLAEVGFDISPNLLFRTLTGVGTKKVRFREISDKFWNEESVKLYWERTKAAWQNVIQRFREYGILSNDTMPTEAALVPMVAMVEKFPEDQFGLPLYWFLQASRFSRYSGSGTTSLEEDLRDIHEADTLRDAVTQLLRRFPHETQLEPEDFLRDYADSRFGRFLLYLLAYRNHALDWDKSGQRLGFDGTDLLMAFNPQWHHIFPKAYLQSHKINDELIDALANIAVIGPTINIRISAKAPMDYIQRYEISAQKLAQQYVSEEDMALPITGFQSWLNVRAQKLTDAGNEFLNSLKEGL